MKNKFLLGLCSCLLLCGLSSCSFNKKENDDIKTWNVTFNSNGGSEVKAQEVNDGAKATKPTDPTKDDYVFDNWYTTSEFTGTAYNFDTAVKADLTLYAKWNEVKLNTYKINWHTGSKVEHPAFGEDISKTAYETICDYSKEVIFGLYKKYSSQVTNYYSYSIGEGDDLDKIKIYLPKSLDAKKDDEDENSLFSKVYILSEGIMKFEDNDAVDYADTIPTLAFFANCENLTLINLDKIDTSSVTVFGGMFATCSKLTSIVGLDKIDTSNAINMNLMFSDTYKLSSLDLTHLNTSKVISMESMFFNCGVKYLDLSSFDTSQVKNLMCMFENGFGEELETQEMINLSSFDTSNVDQFDYMFKDSHQLKTIYVSSSFVLKGGSTSDNMFLNCKSLKGGKGTSYSQDSPVVDGSYANLDNPPDNPGYFTLKS